MISAPGPLELIVILVVALIFLGPKRLPDAARSLGTGVREFRDSLSGDRDDHGYEADDDHDVDDTDEPDDDEPDVNEEDAEDLKEAAKEAVENASKDAAADAEPQKQS
jgi:sec-independent protein translocase protein TatA